MEPPKRIPSIGTVVAAVSVSITPRDTASAAAQSTAMLECSEPSYPTTTPALMADLLLAQVPACAIARLREGVGGPGHGAEGPESREVPKVPSRGSEHAALP